LTNAEAEITGEKIVVIESKLAKAVVDLLCILVRQYEATPREVILVLEHTGLGRLVSKASLIFEF
jgi:hypothetical protein